MITVPLNSHGEIIDVNEADQFQPARSQFECGYFSCAIARSMARPGQPATLSIQTIIEDAEAWYAQYTGSNSISNTSGMTSTQLYDLLHQIGLHYQATTPNAATALKWLAVGYPLIAAILETSVHDLDPGLDGRNPYPWRAAGSHVIVLTGVDDENFLVRDSANCTNLYNPNSLRPGPRVYNAGLLEFVSLTVAVPPWMPRPTSNEPPAIPPVEVSTNYKLPGTRWIDDGTTLSVNGVPVVGLFREHILTNPWDAEDIPLAPEEQANPVEIGWNQSNGQNAGARQIFFYSELARTSVRAPYRVSVGREFYTALQRLEAQTPAPEPAPTPEPTPAPVIEPAPAPSVVPLPAPAATENQGG